MSKTCKIMTLIFLCFGFFFFCRPIKVVAVTPPTITPDPLEEIVNPESEMNTPDDIPLIPEGISIRIGGQAEDGSGSTTLQLLFLVTILTLLPTVLLMMTSFTRMIIALYFIRSALGTQQMPPNQVMIGLALFMTIFLMQPVLTDMNAKALEPYARGEITQREAIDLGLEPLRGFMIKQVEVDDVALFTKISGETYATKEDVPNSVLIPAFILGEITKGFRFGFVIYLPFIIIDMVVASVLMAMGMMMLPPAMISLPFKLLLFVLVDGWSLVVETLLMTFR